MKKRITVIGGGFSGLTTAYYFRRSGFSVEVHEKSSSWGGVLQTHHTKFGMIETAANGILKTPTLVNLCQDINVRLLSSQKKKRFIYRNQPRQWPLTKKQTLQLLPSLISLLINKNSKKPTSGQTLADWTRQNLGTPALDYLVAPALQGVYADDPENMSAPLVLAPFFRSKKSHMVAPEKGMGDLVNQLVVWLKKHCVDLYTNSPYTLPKKWTYPHIICTDIKSLPSFHPALIKSARVKTLSLVSTTVFFRPSLEDLDGFGCLFPKAENFFHLGVLFNNCIFENRSQYRSETWIGKGNHLSDEELLKKVLQDRLRIQKDTKIESFQITRWSNVLPRYGKSLEEFLEDLHLPPQLYLNGNYLGRIGLSGILERSSSLPKIVSSV